MSVTSSSDDPVATIVGLLEGTPESDWPSGTKPDPIQERRESSIQDKLNQRGPAAYVRSPEAGTREAIGAEWEDVDQEEFIGVEVWSRDDDESATLTGDIVAILDDYSHDFTENTNWMAIRPVSVNDQRDEESTETVMGRRANQYIHEVRVELRRAASTGT